jgi:hypothetical protein
METKFIVKLVGVVIGAIATILLVTQHPLHVGAIALGAAVYFSADIVCSS